MRGLDRIVARMRKHAREKPATVDRLIVKFLINVKRVSIIFANSRLWYIKGKKGRWRCMIRDTVRRAENRKCFGERGDDLRNFEEDQEITLI